MDESKGELVTPLFYFFRFTPSRVNFDRSSTPNIF